jgi:hypothetical protein
MAKLYPTAPSGEIVGTKSTFFANQTATSALEILQQLAQQGEYHDQAQGHLYGPFLLVDKSHAKANDLRLLAKGQIFFPTTTHTNGLVWKAYVLHKEDVLLSDKFEMDVTKMSPDGGLTMKYGRGHDGNQYGYFHYNGEFTHHDGLVYQGFPLVVLGSDVAIQTFLQHVEFTNKAVVVWTQILSTQHVKDLRNFGNTIGIENTNSLRKPGIVEALAKYAVDRVTQNKVHAWVFHKEVHVELVEHCTKLDGLKKLCTQHGVTIPLHPTKVALVSNLLENITSN